MLTSWLHVEIRNMKKGRRVCRCCIVLQYFQVDRILFFGDAMLQSPALLRDRRHTHVHASKAVSTVVAYVSILFQVLSFSLVHVPSICVKEEEEGFYSWV